MTEVIADLQGVAFAFFFRFLEFTSQERGKSPLPAFSRTGSIAFSECVHSRGSRDRTDLMNLINRRVVAHGVHSFAQFARNSYQTCAVQRHFVIQCDLSSGCCRWCDPNSLKRKNTVPSISRECFAQRLRLIEVFADHPRSDCERNAHSAVQVSAVKSVWGAATICN